MEPDWPEDGRARVRSKNVRRCENESRIRGCERRCENESRGCDRENRACGRGCDCKHQSACVLKNVCASLQSGHVGEVRLENAFAEVHYR